MPLWNWRPASLTLAADRRNLCIRNQSISLSIISGSFRSLSRFFLFFFVTCTLKTEEQDNLPEQSNHSRSKKYEILTLWSVILPVIYQSGFFCFRQNSFRNCVHLDVSSSLRSMLFYVLSLKRLNMQGYNLLTRETSEGSADNNRKF